MRNIVTSYPIVLMLLSFPVVPFAATPLDYTRDIAPILAENCFECHGPDKAARKADLRLDSDTGDKDWSALLKRIGSLDPEEVMPPPKTGKRLSVEEINSLKKWIESGARYERHWAFRPIRQHEPPSIGGNELTEIDRFIVDGLKTKGLKLSKPISRQRLIRRATFDLTGLPPSWSEVEVFVNDVDSDEVAFAKVVDRLLESPAYGERWGRHWLDLARYADTHGGSAIGFKRFPFSTPTATTSSDRSTRTRLMTNLSSNSWRPTS